MFFCDSSVCVGAFSKGRSSSFKLNGITRACLGHTVFRWFELALIWVSTHFNPADFPSRNIPLPPPGPIPEAYRQYFAHGPWEYVRGLELFSGVGMLAKAFRDAGHRMAEPWDIKLSSHFDILNKEAYARIMKILESGYI